MNMTVKEAKQLSCDDCPYLIFKGDDEQYCRIAHYRMFTRQKWQNKPKFCPIMKRAYEEERNLRSENAE